MSRTIIDSNIAPGQAFKNRIINGDMSIDQRNVGGSVAINDVTVYTADRFPVTDSTDGALSAQRQGSTPPSGFQYYLRLACTTADVSIGAAQYSFIYQTIEGYNLADLLWGSSSAKPVTLSFWVRGSLTGTYCGALRNQATDRSYVFEYAISAADTWEKKAITILGPTTGTWITTNGIGVHISFCLASGTNYHGASGSWLSGNYIATANQVNFLSSNTTREFDITGIQLELGTVATGFECLSFTTKLQLCQRYFCKSQEQQYYPGQVAGSYPIGGAAKRGTSITSTVSFSLPVTMRALPTVTLYRVDGVGTGAWHWLTGGDPEGTSGPYTSAAFQITDNSFSVRTAATGTSTGGMGHWSAQSEL